MSFRSACKPRNDEKPRETGCNRCFHAPLRFHSETGLVACLGARAGSSLARRGQSGNGVCFGGGVPAQAHRHGCLQNLFVVCRQGQLALFFVLVVLKQATTTKKKIGEIQSTREVTCQPEESFCVCQKRVPMYKGQLFLAGHPQAPASLSC